MIYVIKFDGQQSISKGDGGIVIFTTRDNKEAADTVAKGHQLADPMSRYLTVETI